jgi:hypothetical protein
VSSNKIDIAGGFFVSRRPNDIGTIRITTNNMESVRQWINSWPTGYYATIYQGVLVASKDPEYPSEGFRAYAGDYLIFDGGVLKRYTHPEFWARYYVP